MNTTTPNAPRCQYEVTRYGHPPLFIEAAQPELDPGDPS